MYFTSAFVPSRRISNSATNTNALTLYATLLKLPAIQTSNDIKAFINLKIKTTSMTSQTTPQTTAPKKKMGLGKKILLPSNVSQ
ncbi:hypothetical protein [Lacibacter cauensis]|uniref:hypothetical protein n=1 Tax=Lacibacter cauensis TaxID=510947 RepID=UPI0011A42706|nr:hypothetical protein [Lacibacter cauensis]